MSKIGRVVDVNVSDELITVLERIASALEKQNKLTEFHIENQEEKCGE